MMKRTRGDSRSRVQPARGVLRSETQTGRQLFATYPTMPADGGRMLADDSYVSLHMRQAAVEEARRKFQMKYDKEAKEAAEKKKQREQKKREEWLARQEALVRPGHILGRGGIVQQNLFRDHVECQYEDESQQDTNKTEQNWIHDHYNTLVQQRMEREKEAAQLQRHQGWRKEVKVTEQGAIVRPGIVSGSGLSNQAAGTSSDMTSSRSHSYGFAIQPTVTNRGHVLGAVSAESASHAVGVNSATVSQKSDSYARDVQADYREEMLAARRRLQEQYDAQIREAAEAKEQEETGIAERLDYSCHN